MTKVTDLLKNSPFTCSFEVTPDVSEEDIDSLEIEPLFFSVTWHAKSHQCEDLNISSLRTADMLTSKKKQVLLHISCDLLRINYLKQLLTTLQQKNICNLFLVLGESYNPETSDFKSTSQLIKFIRDETGNYFCIGVAGFPDCSDQKLLHLREKFDNGANFVITQAFFEFNMFKTFKERCEKKNIQGPIIPGVFCFESHKQLIGFINLCKVKVSSDLLEYVKCAEQSDKPCSEVLKMLLQKLQTELKISHFHFFTLNKFPVVTKFIQHSSFQRVI